MWRHDRLRTSRWLIALAALIVVGSIAPGMPLESWSGIVAKLRAGATFTFPEPAALTALERLSTFLPLGVLGYRELVRRRFRWPWPAVCGALVLFATTVELAQSGVVGRHPRLADLAMALVFGCCGAALAAWLGERPARWKVRGLLFAALVVGNTGVILTSVQLHQSAELSGWDCRYPLLLTNERSEDRPWQGRLRGLAIYPMALSAPDVAHLQGLPFASPGTTIRERVGALAVFDFGRLREGRIPQLLSHGLDLALMLPPGRGEAWQLDDGTLAWNGRSVIKGTRASQDLCRRVMESGEFSIEVAFASAGNHQGGPARIISQSTSVHAGNFMLGEEFGRLVFRVRSPWNGPYGSRVPLETGPVLLPDTWHHVVAAYERGTAKLFLDGVEIAPPIRYYERLWLGEGRSVSFAPIAGAMFVLMGAIGTLLASESSSFSAKIGVAYLAASLVPSVAVLALGLWLGHDLPILYLAAALTGPPIGVLIVLMFSRLGARSPARLQ